MEEILNQKEFPVDLYIPFSDPTYLLRLHLFKTSSGHHADIDLVFSEHKKIVRSLGQIYNQKNLDDLRANINTLLARL